MFNKFFKRLFCKHLYVNVLTIERTTDVGKVKGTRDECQKCGKVKINAEFLD